MNKANVNPSIVTRDTSKIAEPTGNIYKSIAIIGKRSRQISVNVKEEISNKLSEFSTGVDNLEEVFENREQIEISKFFEKQPKPSTLAVEEFVADEIYWRGQDEELPNQ
jgi:DNA-directed RNA polymerase subunit K/omega